jgi:glycosyltransferase involved in cell wall biosynthesis
MRIMLVSETYTPSVNGAAVFTERLAVGLVGRGHQVAIVAPSPLGGPWVEGSGTRVTTYRVRSMPTPYPQQRYAWLSRRGAMALLTAFQPDLLHIQNHFVLGRTLAQAARLLGLPVVGTNHFMPENLLAHAPGVLRWRPLRRALRRALWRQCIRVYDALNAVTVPSHAAAALVRAQGLQVALHVISNGVDGARFHPRGTPSAHERGPRPPTLLYVGRLDPDKGVDTLLQAMPHVLRAHQACLVLCGRGVQAPKLRQLAERLGLGRAIRFRGFVRDHELPAVYRAATLFVMPSVHELQSMATLEAMASGLPVVAADALALPELVVDEGNGFLCPPGDPMALADRIRRVLADVSLAARLGQASRAIAARHDFERTLHTFEGLYGQLTPPRLVSPAATGSR